MKRKESTTPRIPPVHPPKTKPDLPALREAREEIDRIDEQMRALFLRRMEIVRGIAAQKAELRLPIYDAEREFRILRAAAKACGDDGLRPYYLSFQKSTLALSRAYQNALSAIRDGAGGVRLDVALADASYPDRKSVV